LAGSRRAAAVKINRRGTPCLVIEPVNFDNTDFVFFVSFVVPNTHV
jgi:hypothetical protein